MCLELYEMYPFARYFQCVAVALTSMDLEKSVVMVSHTVVLASVGRSEYK